LFFRIQIYFFLFKILFFSVQLFCFIQLSNERLGGMKLP